MASRLKEFHRHILVRDQRLRRAGRTRFKSGRTPQTRVRSLWVKPPVLLLDQQLEFVFSKIQRRIILLGDPADLS